MNEATLNETSRQKQRWQLVAFFFYSGVFAATWSSRIPDIQRNLSLNNAQLGTVLFAVPVGLVAGLSVAGWLVASFGTRRIMFWSCLSCAAFLSLAGLASSSILLMAALFFVGLSRTVLNLAANTSALELQKRYERPILSTFHGIWSLACVVAAGVGTLLIVRNVQPSVHFALVGALVALAALLLSPGHKDLTLQAQKRPFFVKPDRYLLLLGLTALCAMLCEGAAFDWSVKYFDNAVRVPRSLSTVGYLAFMVAMASGRFAGDYFIHRFGAHRMLMVNGLLLSVGFLLATAFPFLFPAAAGFFLIGAGDSILVPVVYMLAGRSKKMQAGYALAAVTLIGYVGFLTGPLLIGNVAERFGLPAAFFFLSVASALIVLLSRLVKQSSPD